MKPVLGEAKYGFPSHKHPEFRRKAATSGLSWLPICCNMASTLLDTVFLHCEKGLFQDAFLEVCDSVPPISEHHD